MATFTFRTSTFTQGTTEDWNYESVGTLKDIKDFKGKKVQFTKKNLKGDSRVTLQIFPKKYAKLEDAINDDAVQMLPCTAPLSKIVRKALANGSSHNKVLSYLVTLEVQKDIEDDGKYFLFQEKGDGEGLPAFLMEDLVKDTVNLDDLAAF